MSQSATNVSFSSDVLPLITRSDASYVMIHEHTGGNPEDYPLEIDLHIRQLQTNAWPVGLLSYNGLMSTDRNTALHYSQWTSEAAYQAFLQTDAVMHLPAINGLTPKPEGQLTKAYQLYRVMDSEDANRKAGCIVAVTFGTENAQMQRHFVDTLIETVTTQLTPHPGMIASHFILSTDGKRIINYAEFTSEQAHEEALQTNLRDGGAVMQLIRNMPGLQPLGFKRYKLYRSLGKP